MPPPDLRLTDIWRCSQYSHCTATSSLWFSDAIMITSYVLPTEPAHPRSHGSRYRNQRNQKEDTYIQSEHVVHSVTLSCHFHFDEYWITSPFTLFMCSSEPMATPLPSTRMATFCCIPTCNPKYVQLSNEMTCFWSQIWTFLFPADWR